MGSSGSILKYNLHRTTPLSQDHEHQNPYSHLNNLQILRLLSSYCPHSVLQLLENKTLVEPISVNITGACLLADICGFTKFSGDLCNEGVTGIDKLRITTSTFLTKFIEIIYFYYGDVMAFAGDALICVFAPRQEDNNDPSKCCLRAIHCGNELKLLKTNALSAHIAIDYGRGRLALIGGYENNWTYIYDGECFACLGNCINEAAIQELVISSALAKEIENCPLKDTNSLTFKRLSSGNYLIGCATIKNQYDSIVDDVDLVNEKLMKSLMIQQLRTQALHTQTQQLFSFIPAPILHNISHYEPLKSLENISSSSELRRVTCLFLKFDSYISCYPLHDLQKCFYNWQEIILKLGGYIRQIVTDDKGCVLIALWGVPTASHVNDTIRALTAVSEISLFCKNNNYHVSMGLTTGDVYCGMIGSKYRCDYAAVGSSINFSARLMAKSKGKVYLDETTNYHLQSSAFDCSLKLPLMHFKGRNEPVQVYQFLDTKFRDTSAARTFTNPFLVSGSGGGCGSGCGSGEHDTSDSPSPFNLLFDDTNSVDNKTTTGTGTGSGLIGTGTGGYPECRKSATHEPSFVGVETIMKLNQAVQNQCNWHGAVYIEEEDEDMFEGSYITRPVEENCIQVIHVSGTVGTGKTEIANQLIHLCGTQNIKTVSLSLTELDLMTEYSVIRQIFIKFIGENHYHDLHLQKQIITSLFFETYPPHNTSRFLRAKWECLREILGLNWMPIELKIKNTFSVSSIRLKIRGGGGGGGGGIDESITQNSKESSGYDIQDPLQVFLEFFLTLCQSGKPLTIILDEAQYCDAPSWSIIFNILTHLRAPIIFLFTVTEPRRNGDEITIDSDDYNETKGSNNNVVPFLSSQYSNGSITQRKKKFSENPISSIDPFGDGSPIHITQRMKLLETLQYYSKLTTIKLHGLSKRQVRIILQQSLKSTNITSTLVNIVTVICEGNAYWCKVIVDFIIQYDEDSFCKTFCCNTTDEEIIKSPTRTIPMFTSTPRETITPGMNHHSHHPHNHHPRISPSIMNKKIEPIPSDQLMSMSQDEDFGHSTGNETSGKETSFGGRGKNANAVADTILYRLITTLMDRLTYQEKEILKYAAVCGAKFHSELIRLVVSPSLVDQCESILNSLKRYKFISSSRGRMNYSFISYRMRDIIYSLIPCSDACALHYIVAKQMEVLYKYCLETFYEVLTFHYTMASSSPFELPKEEFYHEVVPQTQMLTTSTSLKMPSVTTPSPKTKTTSSFAMIISAITSHPSYQTTPTTPNGTAVVAAAAAASVVSSVIAPTTNSIDNLNSTADNVEYQRKPKTYSCYILTVHEIVKKKSYEYSYLSAKLLYRLEEYHRAVDYIKYAAQEEAIELLGDGYRKGIIRFLSNWTMQTDEKQKSTTTTGPSKRIPGSSQRLPGSARYVGLMDTFGTISILLNSLQEEE